MHKNAQPEKHQYGRTASGGTMNWREVKHARLSQTGLQCRRSTGQAASSWYGGMTPQVSSVSLDEERTLEVVGGRYGGVSEQVREIEGCEITGTLIEGGSLGAYMLTREAEGGRMVVRGRERRRRCDIPLVSALFLRCICWPGKPHYYKVSAGAPHPQCPQWSLRHRGPTSLGRHQRRPSFQLVQSSEQYDPTTHRRRHQQGGPR